MTLSTKTLLVGQREYIDNVRTKTFWIGIGAFPLLLVLCVAVPAWLEGRGDVREYAVLDHSSWLLERIEERANTPDLEAVLRLVVERYRTGGPPFEQLPEFLRAMAPFLDTLKEDQLHAVARALRTLRGPGGGELVARLPMAGALREKLGEFDRMQDELYGELGSWWRSLPPEEAEALAPAAAEERYVRVAVEFPAGEDPQEFLRGMLAREEVFAYFVIPADPVADGESFLYVSANLTDNELKRWFESLATDEVRSARIAQKKIDPEVAEWIQRPLRFASRRIDEEGAEAEVETGDEVHQWAPVAFVYLLWISIFTVAQMLLTNTIEEKSNRILEVLLSSVSPLELMVGKILGIAATGLTVVLSWFVFFIIGAEVVPHFLDGFPELNVLALVDDPVYLASFVAYFLLGYLFYASLLVGVGSVCNTIKEAQNLMTPVIVFLVVPLLAMVPIAKDPNGTLARVLSFVPPFTPFVMMNRAAAPPERWEYVATTALLVASIAAAMWAAAKVFRIGILMTGKPPTPGEILGWVVRGYGRD